MASPSFIAALNVASGGAPPSGDFVSAVLTDSPISWWRLLDNVTNGAAAKNEVIGANAGTYVVPSADLALQPGPGIVAGAAKSYAKAGVPNAGMKVAAPNIAGDYSIETWFSCTGPGGGSTPMIAAIDYYQRLFQLRVNAGKVQFLCLRDTFVFLTGGPDIVGTGRHHAVATVSSGSTSGNINLYVDGLLVQSGTGQATTAVNTDLCVGCYQDPNSLPEYQFQGDLADIVLYGSVLSPARVLAHWNAGK